MFMNFVPRTIIKPESDVNVIMEIANRLNDEEKQRLIEITSLTADRPDLRKYAINFEGNTKELLAALVNIRLYGGANDGND